MNKVCPELLTTFIKVWNHKNNIQVSHDTVNYGWCYQFAVVMHIMYGWDMVSHPGGMVDHAWCTTGGMFFDSVNMSGGVNGLVGHLRERPRIVTLKQMKLDWHERGRSGPVQMETIIDVIRLYCQKELTNPALDLNQFVKPTKRFVLW